MRTHSSSTPVPSGAPQEDKRPLVIAREAAGRPRQSTSPRQPISLRRRAVLLVLSAAMLLQMLAPMSTPQPASAVGTGNSHGTTLQTRVGTKSLSMYKSIPLPPSAAAYVDADKLPTYDNNVDFACQPGKITKQNKMDTVYLQTLITWGSTEPANPAGVPTLTFAKPAGATFALSGDSSTQGYVDAVSGDQGTTAAQITDSTQITLTFKSGLIYSGMFNIDYNYTYNVTTSYDGMITNVTPVLNIPGSSTSTGDDLRITVACQTIPYLGLTVNTSPSKLNGSNNGDNYTNFDTNIDSYLNPATNQLARVDTTGSIYTYKLYPEVQVKQPNAPYANTGNVNANIPQSATFTLTLPSEAQLVSTPSGWTREDVGGHIVLTTSTWSGGSFDGFGSVSLVQQLVSAGSLQVYYTEAPANGLSYVYSAKVTGNWYDGTYFSAENTNINHIFDPNPKDPSLNFSLAAYQITASFSGGGQVNDGSAALYTTQTNKYLALGDHENFVYTINNNLTGSNPSEVILSNFTVTIPFQGDIWDIAHFIRVTPDRYDTMTVTYSDDSTAVFSVGDTTKFDTVPGSAAASNMRGTNSMSWLMAGKGTGVFIKQLSFHAVPGYTFAPGVAIQSLLGIEVVLRSVRPNSDPVVPGVDVGKNSFTVTVPAPLGMTTDPMERTVAASSVDVPIYEKQVDRPCAWDYVNSGVSITGIPVSGVNPGDSFAITARSGFTSPATAYNARIPNPTLTLKLPSSLSFDYSEVQLLLDYGPTNTSISPNSRALPAADYTVSVTSSGGYTYYAFTYIGDVGSGSGNSGVLTYFGDYHLVLIGVVSVVDDATSATAVPLQVNMTSPDIGGTAPAINGSVNIVVPVTMTAALNASGDLFPGVWVKDIDGSDDTSLAKVNHSGILRYQVINNSISTYSGEAYVKVPAGTLASYLSLQSVSTDLINGATHNLNPASVVWYYSLIAPSSGDDLTTIPSASWVAFTPANLADPITLPVGVKAFRLTGISTAPGDRLNITLNYNVSSSAVSGTTARSIAQLTLGGFNDVSSYAGFKVVHSSYKVNYYKDSVAPANFIDSSAAIDADYGTEITLGTGTTNGLIGYLCPAGYTGGIQQDPVPYVMQDGDQTV
ncbi:MAG: hypothetical protein FWD65_06535, partial [Coriobacteriia bacterium]|nr:hypothetical protein [Coriobacteriia bacterium]